MIYLRLDRSSLAVVSSKVIFDSNRNRFEGVDGRYWGHTTAQMCKNGQLCWIFDTGRNYISLDIYCPGVCLDEKALQFERIIVDPFLCFPFPWKIMLD